MGSKCSCFKSFFNKIFKKKSKELNARNAIEEIIEEDEREPLQSIANDEKEMIGNVLDLRDIQVQDVMIPKVSIISIQTTARIEDIITKFVDNKLATLLVYQGNNDNIIGVLHLKDVASWFKTYLEYSIVQTQKQFNINLFVREVLFIPPTMKTLDLLFQMKQTGNKIAVIIDEYGCVSGLVSLMDLMEEIVGDIKDATEIKQQKNKIIVSNDGSILADGKSTFYEIEKYGNLKIIPNDDFNDTIGGMITSMIGRVPVKGELIAYQNQLLEFEIVDSDARRIKSIRIRNTNK